MKRLVKYIICVILLFLGFLIANNDVSAASSDADLRDLQLMV